MKYFLLFFVFCLGLITNAQDVQPCSQGERTDELFENHPNQIKIAKKAEEELQIHTEDYKANKGGDEQIYIIPVVYHVIYQTPNSNISDEQIYSSVEVLNRDFRLENADYINAPEVFSNIAADIQIEFRLAKIDPQGNCTKGINRIQSALTYAGDSEMKELIDWPRNKYLNIWICTEAGGAAGYTFLPSSTNGPFMADQDGIVLLHSYTGAIGTSNNSRSRTLSHEVGHWLNLPHVWGGTNTPELPSNCSDDDNVDDTPLTIGHSGTCDQSLESCGSLDNINNYMDYSPCRFMFTEGQRTRMRAAVTSSISQRNQLWQDSNLLNTGVFNEEEELCMVEFSSQNQSGCVGTSIVFEDASYNGVIERTWDFGDGNTYTTTDPEENSVTYTYETSGIYDIELTVSDGNTEFSDTKNNYINIFNPEYIGTELLEGFENNIDELVWSVENPDNDYGWEIEDDVALGGTSCLKLRNRNISLENSLDAINSSVINLEGNEEVFLEYSWAFALKPGDETDDRLKVRISYNCGETWITKIVHRGTTDLPTAGSTSSTFVPANSSEWNSNTITIDNPTQITNDFRVKIEFTAKGGNHIYLDNINIYGSNNVSVSELSNSTALLLSPNPVNDELNIHIPNSIELQETSIHLVDISGRIVKNIATNQKLNGTNRIITTDLSSVPTGLYFVTLISNNGNLYSQKLIVK